MMDAMVSREKNNAESLRLQAEKQGNDERRDAREAAYRTEVAAAAERKEEREATAAQDQHKLMLAILTTLAPRARE